MTNSIGTYGEKTLHRELKWYIEPRGNLHEAPVGKYIADIKAENGITEIQTRSFEKLRPKLTAFLPEHAVTLVYPIAHEKTIIWVDADTGEVVRTRRSPKRGSFYSAFRELYRIKPLLTDANLRLRLILADISERRSSGGGRKGYHKIDTELRALYDELIIDGADDYAKLIPAPLFRLPFTAADYASAARISKKDGQTALNVLRHVGAVTQIGKSGRAYLYHTSGSVL